MSIRVDGLYSQYNDYKVDFDRIKQGIKKKKESGSSYDVAVISEEGKKALENKMLVFSQQRSKDVVGHLSPISSYGYMNDFEKALSDLGKENISGEYMTGDYEKEVVDIAIQFEIEEGKKTDSFDCHVNKTVSVYNLMREKIEEKYSDSEKETEYYVSYNGKIEELTKEIEIEMLDQVYANHSTFIATSTEIWAGLQDYTPTVIYHKGGNKQVINDDVAEHSEKGKIKDMVLKAFMSAVSDENRNTLEQQEGSLRHFKLDLGVSSSARNMLNGIWDFYASKA
ncbi:MAG: hypothetical protein IKW30_02770 [Lachnospiraceae bacterium]|nr:hypothetical protein [Lachnospiraceae bacterium]